MADGVTFEFVGLEALQRDIAELTVAVRKRIAIGMVAKGATWIKNEAKLLAPEWTGPVEEGHPPPGALKDAIYAARLVRECTDDREAWVIGVRAGKAFQTAKRGKGTVNIDAYYASWVEYGHYTRTAKGSTKSAKAAGRALGVASWIPAHPYMRPAFDHGRTAAFNAMQAYFESNLAAATTGLRILKAAA